MATPFIVPQKKGRQHREKLKIKTCRFPGCKIEQAMTSKACFCDEHRNRKYRKTIDAGKIEAKKAEEELKSANQSILHTFKDSTLIKMNCGLGECNKEFDIKLFPKVHIYPKFCPDHRNSFKRELFLKQNS